MKIIKNNFVQDKEFTHCLRAQIYPDKYYLERINSILKFALKYNFKNIILMFNGEEFCSGHLDINELKPWVKVIKDAKTIFVNHHITTSINPWFEFGHLDRGRKLKKGQNFQLMYDKNAHRTEMVACPLDPAWRAFYLKTLEYYVKETKPEVLWIEDDFRLHNHAPLEWGGCFCDDHLALINKHLKKKLSRKQIVDEIIKGGPARKAWLESSWFTMDSLAQLISNKVKKVSPATSIALMSSMPEAHQMEGRHWQKLLSDLSSNGVYIDRVHLPCYIEISPKQYLYFFNANSMVVRALIGDNAYIYPELENSVFSQFSKSAKFLGFQLESALPLGLSGMTYDIFEFVGNGAQNEFLYGEEIKKASSYLNAVKNLNLKPSELSGLLFPLDEMSVLNRQAHNWYELIPDEQKGISYFSSLGYSFKFSINKRFKNETIVLTGQNIFNFSKTELINLFKDNFVILDGESAKYLIDLKLGYLIDAISYKQYHANDGSYSFEMSEEMVNKIHHYRGGLEKSAANYVNIQYTKGVKILSKTYNYHHKVVGPSFTKGKNFLINPYIYQNINYEQFSVLKDYLYANNIIIKKPMVKSLYQGIYTYLFVKKKKKVIFLSNAAGDFKDISLKINNFNVHKVSYINQSKTIKSVRFTLTNNKLTIKMPFNYLSTCTLLID